jgi:glycerol-3-phosphate dehydrogenase
MSGTLSTGVLMFTRRIEGEQSAMSSTQYDVVIIGGGIVGLATAMALKSGTKRGTTAG